MKEIHQSVMPAEALAWLAPASGGGTWWADLTVGAGGHTEALLQATAPEGRVLGLDRDAEILELTRQRLAPYGARAVLVQANFADLGRVAREQGITELAGALMDLGVSSLQLDQAERGFSFQQAGPLDMRMDRSQDVTAAWILNHADEEELARIFYEYGGERRSRRLAREVVRRRPLRDTLELAELARRAVGYSGRLHPATRAFQGLRLAVNDELGALAAGLRAADDLLQEGGRLVVISFHSLEDRIVKQHFRAGGWEVLTKHVIRPGADEERTNPRARSARLRAAVRRRA
jgi:16S rRNA (cytosine1402-N4)-methyltransferase